MIVGFLPFPNLPTSLAEQYGVGRQAKSGTPSLPYLTTKVMVDPSGMYPLFGLVPRAFQAPGTPSIRD